MMSPELSKLMSCRCWLERNPPSISPNAILLCVYELLNFQQGRIEAYRYKVSQCHIPFIEHPLPESEEYCRASYAGKEKLYWYDSWPHPNDPSLALTHPHHKHIPPDIKHHRVPAPGLSFTRPNLPFLIEEIERELLKQGE
jgi:hypothetical protein